MTDPTATETNGALDEDDDARKNSEGDERSKNRPNEQLQQIWQTLLENQNAASDQIAPGNKDDSNRSSGNSLKKNKTREWPSYDVVMSGIVAADYNQILTCPMDTVIREEGKMLCPHGVVCCARLELFEAPPYYDHHYTGILTPGTSWDHCLLRLSSALQPPGDAISSTWARTLLYTAGEKLRTAQLFPMTALKVFVDGGEKSRNVLFGGSKVGQRETDFFAHCQCTTMTERMPSLAKRFCRKFWDYSKWPLSLGLSEFCAPLGHNPTAEVEIHFPFALVLKPTIRSECFNGNGNFGDGDPMGACGMKQSLENKNSHGSFDLFLDFSLSGIPQDCHLFDLFACPTPHDVADPAKLHRIGRISTTSTMLESTPNDGLFFKHQAKEGDYALRPDWPEALKLPISVDQGKIKGTVGTLAGWELFEQQINKKQYVDFEYGSIA